MHIAIGLRAKIGATAQILTSSSDEPPSVGDRLAVPGAIFASDAQIALPLRIAIPPPFCSRSSEVRQKSGVIRRNASPSRFPRSVLVALSILIAALASYTALDLATRMRAASGPASLGWLGAAAVAMGGGIWSMHFVAMLAFSLPGMDVSYDPLLTVLSLTVPILVAAAAFVVVSQRPNALVVAGIAMGLAISGMHYTGMSAMRMAASIHYDPVWVALSIAIAIGASIVALRLAFHMTSVLERVSAGAVMGMAISGMHYAAMQGSSFIPMDAGLSAQETVRWGRRRSRS